MAAVANGAGLVPSDSGLTFTPGNVEEIATICRPADVGGVLAHEGSRRRHVQRDPRRGMDPVQHPGGRVRRRQGHQRVRVRLLQRIPVAPRPHRPVRGALPPVPLRRPRTEHFDRQRRAARLATGHPTASTATSSPPPRRTSWPASSSTAKAATRSGASSSPPRPPCATGLLPVALAHHVELKNDVAKGQSVSWDDVVIDESLATALELRRETEALVRPDDTVSPATSFSCYTGTVAITSPTLPKMKGTAHEATSGWFAVLATAAAALAVSACSATPVAQLRPIVATRPTSPPSSRPTRRPTSTHCRKSSGPEAKSE